MQIGGAKNQCKHKSNSFLVRPRAPTGASTRGKHSQNTEMKTQKQATTPTHNSNQNNHKTQGHAKLEIAPMPKHTHTHNIATLQAQKCKPTNICNMHKSHSQCPGHSTGHNTMPRPGPSPEPSTGHRPWPTTGHSTEHNPKHNT